MDELNKQCYQNLSLTQISDGYYFRKLLGLKCKDIQCQRTKCDKTKRAQYFVRFFNISKYFFMIKSTFS